VKKSSVVGLPLFVLLASHGPRTMPSHLVSVLAQIFVSFFFWSSCDQLPRIKHMGEKVNPLESPCVRDGV
jgi:hypothetical protein